MLVVLEENGQLEIEEERSLLGDATSERRRRRTPHTRCGLISLIVDRSPDHRYLRKLSGCSRGAATDGSLGWRLCGTPGNANPSQSSSEPPEGAIDHCSMMSADAAAERRPMVAWGGGFAEPQERRCSIMPLQNRDDAAAERRPMVAWGSWAKSFAEPQVRECSIMPLQNRAGCSRGAATDGSLGWRLCGTPGMRIPPNPLRSPRRGRLIFAPRCRAATRKPNHSRYRSSNSISCRVNNARSSSVNNIFR